jgi:hypothetical protein
VTIIVSEIIESGIDITMAIDFVGKLVHFSCAASKINR